MSTPILALIPKEENTEIAYPINHSVSPCEAPPLTSKQHLQPNKTRTMPQRRGPRTPTSQKKPPLTHFLCLPLVTASSKPQLETSIEAFGNHVISAPDQSNPSTHIHPKAIRPVGVLHCTLGVMSLDTEKLEKAIDLLKKLDVERLLVDAASSIPTSQQSTTKSTKSKVPSPSKEPQPSPLKIDLKGLASMHDPQNTSILYIAPSDTSQRLYPFCLALQEIFRAGGVLLPDGRELKLHATIVNTIYAKGRKRPAPNRGGGIGSSDSHPPSGKEQEGHAKVEDGDRSQGHGPRANAPLKLDARALLEDYKDFVWAENVVLDRIAICEMGAKKRFDADGRVVGEEYTEVASVGLPGCWMR